MTCVLRSLLLLIILLAQTVRAGDPPLDEWFDKMLLPSVVATLNSHPRFKNEVLRFVVLKNGEPAAITNALALALRDRLRDDVIAKTGSRVAWEVDRRKYDPLSETQRVDCTTGEALYYVGLEIEHRSNDSYRLTVKALDVAAQNWVSGFGESWRGKLNANQRRQLRQPETDPAWLGQRSVPFDESQTDLVAAQLAHELGCSLLRELSGEYVARPISDKADSEIIALVVNNLATYKALQITADDVQANSVIESRAHEVDDDLYQYWITIAPTSPKFGMPAISASVYVYMPEQYLSAKLLTHISSEDVRSSGSLISSLSLIELDDAHACFSNTSHQSTAISSGLHRDCFALEAAASADSVMIFLYHQLNNGLVRLAGPACMRHTEARIARQHEDMIFPIQLDASETPEWLPAAVWSSDPREDTYYVVASSSSKAARALSSHIEQLPQRCGSSLRPGLEGKELRRWFNGLDAIVEHWSSEIDWRSIRVKNIF